jgi:DNA polymerase I-like protein with 3'-5' exonuclease and polymerase domains
MKLKLPARLTGEKVWRGQIPVVDGLMALDTECTGLDPWGTMGVDRLNYPALPFAISMCNADGDTTYLRWQVDATTRRVAIEDNTWLRLVLLDEKVVKVLFNGTYDLRMLELGGYTIRGEVFDCMLAAHTLWPYEYTHQLKPLTKKFCSIEDDDIKSLMVSVQKARNAVRSARKRIDTGKTKPGDIDLARTAIYEPPRDEYSDKKVGDTNAAKADMWLADAEQYARRDAYRTAVLYETVVSGLDADQEAGGSLWETFRQEQALAPIIKRMEDRGVRLDWKKVDELGAFYHGLMAEHEKAAIDLSHVGFEIGSPIEIQTEAFVHQNLSILNYVIDKHTGEPTRCAHCKRDMQLIESCQICRGTGSNPQCDSEFLAHHGVEHGLDDALTPKNKWAWHVLHFKAARSMLSFVKSYKKFGENRSGTWVIHPNYKQVGPETGRMACERPNLQNVADDDSGKRRCTVPYLIRQCFVPRKDHVFFSPDYSQIEIWLLYLRSGDAELGKILLAGGDTHGKVARACVPGTFDLEQAVADKKVDPDSLSPGRLSNLKAYVKARKKAKNTQFCKVYGGGPSKIAKTAGCSLEEAIEFARAYEATFKGVSSFMRRNTNIVKHTGRIKNFYGREYHIHPQRAYVGTNYDIQGSAADLIKRAMIRVDDVCTRELSNQAHLLLQVHDELLVEAHRDVATESSMRKIAEAMQADYVMWKCPVPFPVGMKVCEHRWSEGREVKL